MIGLRSFKSSLMGPSVLKELEGIAEGCSGGSFESGSDILAFFFESSAWQLLLDAPNRYWFWSLVRRSLGDIAPFDKAEDKRVTAEEIRAAVRKLFCDFGEFRLDLRVADLMGQVVEVAETAALVGQRVAFGLTLVPLLKSERAAVFDNPIFFDNRFILRSPD